MNITTRITGDSEVNDIFDDCIDDVKSKMVTELKKSSPVKTGALRRSIVAGRNQVLVTVGKGYGYIQHIRGPHKGWITKALNKVVTTFNQQ